MSTICELIRLTDASGVERLVQRDRPATPEEEAEIAACKASPPPVPEVVSRFQAKAALFEAGLLSAIEALMADPKQDMISRLAWADAQEFRRDSPIVAALGAALGLGPDQIDALFRAAAHIYA